MDGALLGGVRVSAVVLVAASRVLWLEVLVQQVCTEIAKRHSDTEGGLMVTRVTSMAFLLLLLGARTSSLLLWTSRLKRLPRAPHASTDSEW